MSDLSMPAPSASPAIVAAVQAAVARSTAATVAATEPAQPIVEPAATVATVEPGAPPAEGGEQPQSVEPEAIEDLQLDLDRLPFEKRDGEPQPDKAQLAAGSDSEQLTEALGQKMPRAEAERVVGAFLSTERGKRMLSSFKGMREIAKPSSEGGIGFEPTPDEIVRFHQSHSHLSRFWDDFSSGDPQRQEVLIRSLFSADQDGQRTQGAEQILSTLPSILAQSDPAMFRKLASPVALEITKACSQLASKSGDEDAKSRWADAANLVAYLFDLPVNTGQPPQEDSGELAAIKEELARLRGQQQNGAQQAYTQAVQSLQGGFHKRMALTLESDVKKALEPIADKVDDITFTAYTQALRTQMSQRVRSLLGNETVAREFKHAVDTAARTRDTRPLDAVIKRVRAAYAPQLNEDRQQYIRASLQRAKQAADVTASKLSQAQSRTEPMQGGAQPAAASTAAIPVRNQGESPQEYLARRVAARLTPA